MNKGDLLERNASLYIHKIGTPLLVHPQYLRSKGSGQVDLAIFIKRQSEKTIQLFEIKSSRYPSIKQIRRLKNSANLLAQIFNVSVQLFLLKKMPQNLENELFLSHEQRKVYKAMILH